MTEEDVKNRLKQIKIEDYIWIIYIGIIFLSLYSNELERKYFTNKDIESKNKYRKINTFIFSILFIVYSYFLYSSYSDLKNKNNNKKELVTLSFIASLLVFISGSIFLYISLVDNNIDVEIAFN